jgi:hypothetical protein
MVVVRSVRIGSNQDRYQQQRRYQHLFVAVCRSRLHEAEPFVIDRWCAGATKLWLGFWSINNLSITRVHTGNTFGTRVVAESKERSVKLWVDINQTQCGSHAS